MGRAQAREQGNTLQELDGEQAIRVMEGEGLNLQLISKVEASPDDVYSVLTDPAAKFRSIQACTKREVLESDPRLGRRKMAISHRAITRFLFISVTFETHLLVWEDDRERTIRFTNAREGFMKRFEGTWHVRPFTQRSLDHALRDAPSAADAPAASSKAQQPASSATQRGSRQRGDAGAATPAGAIWTPPWQGAPPLGCQPPPWMAEHWHRLQQGLGAALEQVQAHAEQAARRVRGGGGRGGGGSSLVSLEQHIVTRLPPPPVVKGLLKRLVSKQIKDMLEDLRAELDRRREAKAKAAPRGRQQQQQQRGGGGAAGPCCAAGAEAGGGGGKAAEAGGGKNGVAGGGGLPLASCWSSGGGLDPLLQARGASWPLRQQQERAWEGLWATREPLISITIQI